VFIGLLTFLWYTIVGFLIFKSQRFWTPKVHLGVTLFCVAVFLLFGAYFVGSALMSVFTL
jgi:hypothetical protein